MKAIYTMHSPMFLHAPLPLTASRDENRQQVRPRRTLRLPTLSTDELAASKPEIVCGSILGMCFFYTLVQLFLQMAA